MQNTFIQKLTPLWKEKKFLCVGLDPAFDKLPNFLQHGNHRNAIISFNKEIIDATAEFVCAFKPNSAFYEQYGAIGWEVLKKTIAYIQKKYPDIPIILDSKRADIGNTNNGYVVSAFDELGVDAATINPYMGKESLEPYLNRSDKGILVLVKTSNPGSGEFQNLKVNGEKLLYEVVAENIVSQWNGNKNCGVVVGSPYPMELERVRGIIGDMPMLIPGAGTQGGDFNITVKASLSKNGSGIIVNSSREVLYASNQNDFAEKAHEKAKELCDTIKRSL